MDRHPRHGRRGLFDGPVEPAGGGLAGAAQPWSGRPAAHDTPLPLLPPNTPAHLDAVVDFARRWSPGGGHHHALHVLQILTAAGQTDPDVLAAGALLPVVRSGACPIQEVRRQYGPAVTLILAQLAPARTGAAGAEPAHLAVPRRLAEGSPSVQAVAVADTYVTAAAILAADRAALDELADHVVEVLSRALTNLTARPPHDPGPTIARRGRDGNPPPVIPR